MTFVICKALGCLDGTLWCYQIVFNKVHGLYQEKYAYRENLTDVIIHHLTSGTKVKIKCHDKVQKIAIYKHRLAASIFFNILIKFEGFKDYNVEISTGSTT